MLSRCISRVLLLIVSFVARRLGWPLERYFSSDGSYPLLQLSFTGAKLQVRRLKLLQKAWNEILLQAGLPLHIQSASIEYASLKLSLCGPLVLDVRGLHALSSTTHERYYDASREAQRELDRKKKQLLEIEAEEGKAAVVTQGWFKKKVMQLLKWIALKIVRKLQVSVENVHVRFEDKLSSPEEPLALGCTLRQLSIKEKQKKDHPPMAISVKDVAVAEMAVYWNVNTENLMAELPNTEIEARLQATPFTEAVGYSYVLKPCRLSSSLQTARGSHSLVNVTVGVEVASVTLKLSMEQLTSIIEFLGFFQQLQATRHFLHFRPSVPLIGHARECTVQITREHPTEMEPQSFSSSPAQHSYSAPDTESTLKSITYSALSPRSGNYYQSDYGKEQANWSLPNDLRNPLSNTSVCLSLSSALFRWLYAFKSVVDSIHQSRGAWLWQELKTQRDLSREYELHYENLLIAEKSSSKTLNSLQEKMSLLSIVLSRRRVESSLEVRLRRLLSDLADHWAGKAGSTSSRKKRLAAQSPPLLTASVDCCVRELQLLLVEDEETQDQVLKLDVHNASVKLLQQPKAVRINAKLQSLSCSGLTKNDSSTPLLVSNWSKNRTWSPTDLGDEVEEKGDSPLLKAEFVSYLGQAEPVSGLDYEAEVSLQPLVFIFDKETALKLAEVVPLFRNSHEDLQSLVKEKLHQVNYQNKKKFKKVVTEKKIGLNAELWLPLILVPENGNIDSSDGCLALNSGYLKVETKGMPEQHSVQYSAQLSGMSVSLLEDGKNWYEAMQPGIPPSLKHQLLSSGDVSLSSVVTIPTSDQELQPSTHATVAVPQVAIDLSNSSMEEGVGLVSQQVVTLKELQRVALKTSMKEPPEKSPTPLVYTHHSPSAARIMDDAGRIRSGGHISRHNVRPTNVTDESTDFEDLSLLSISCKIDKISLSITESLESDVEYLYLSAAGVEIHADQRKDTMLASVRVGSLGLRDLSCLTHEKKTPAQIFETVHDIKEDFISVKVCMADVSSLYFKTKYDSVMNDVTINVTPCCLTIYEASLLHLMKFVLSLKLRESISVMFDVSLTEELPTPRTKQVLSPKQPHLQHKGTTNTRVCVQIAEAALELCTAQPFVDLKVFGVKAEVRDTTVQLDTTASVQKFSVTDLAQEHHDYREVVTNKPVQNFLRFECVLRKALEDDPMDDPGTGIRLETSIAVGEISAILLFKFVKTVQLYTTHLMQESLRLWKDMGTQWQTAGQQQDTKEVQPLLPARVFKYHIDVDVCPLVLVVPKQSFSLEQLVLKLHKLHFANAYEFAKLNAGSTASTAGTSQHTLLEKMSLEIDQVSLTRHAPDGTLLSTLANDPNIGVSVMRVVTGQLTSQAKLSVGMDIGEMQVQLSDDDLLTVPEIILNNLSEVEPLFLSYKSPSGTAKVKSPSEAVLKDSSASMDLVDAVINMDSLKCTFSMLKPDLHTFCDIELTQLSTHICYCTDSSLKVSGSLQDISLVDPADKGSVIVKGRQSQADAPVMEIAVKLEPNKEMEVNGKLRHIHAYIWPTLTANFLKFVIASIPKPVENLESDTASVIIAGAVADEEAVFEEHSLNLSVVVAVDGLSLALLESSNSSPSYGICVELHPAGTQTQGMKLEFDLAPSDVKLQCDSLCFGLSICHVNGETVELVQVVNPCCLRLSYLSSSQEETATLEASKLVVFLTNEAIKTISGPVKECIRLLQREMKDPEREQDNLSGNIWEVRNIDRDKELEKLKTLREEESETIPKENKILLLPKKKQQATLNLPEVIVNCDVLYAGDSTSLLCLTTAIEAGINSWSTELAIDAQLKVDAFVYNHRVAAWEPLIEPLEDPIQGCYRPWAMVTKVRQVGNKTSTAPTRGPISISSGSEIHKAVIPPSPSILPISRGSATPSQLAEDISLSTIPENTELSGHAQPDERGGKTMVVVLSSDDRLELTVSPGAIQTLQDLVNSFGEDDVTVKEHLASCIPENRLPMLIKNETGLNVMVFPGPTFKTGLNRPHFSAPILLRSLSGKSSPTETSSVLGEAASDTKPLTSTTCKLAYCSLKELSPSEEYASGESSSSSESDEEDEYEEEEDEYEDEEEEQAEEEREEDKGEKAKEDDDEEGQNESSKKMTHLQLNKVLKVPQNKQRGKCKNIPGSVHGTAHLRQKIRWKPKSLSKNHMICFQAERGKKSKGISVSLPAMTPISLYLPPSMGSAGGKVVKGMCEVKVVGGVRSLTIRSLLQVKNTLSYSVSLHAHVDGTRQFLSLLEQGESYDVPVPLVACGCPLQVDVVNATKPSDDLLDWKEFIENKTPVVLESSTNGEHIFFQAVVESQLLVHRREHEFRPAYVILLQPALSLQNLLPLPAKVTVQGSNITDAAIAPGETKHFYQVDLRREPTIVFQLPDYHELKWVGEASLGLESHVATKIRMNGFNLEQQVAKMYLTIHSDAKQPSLFQLYSPYWLVNKTGLPLEYEHQPTKSWLHKNIRSSDSGSPNSVTLIYYKPNVDREHRKLKLRLLDGQWSQEIVLSAAGKGENLSSVSTEGVIHEFGIQNRFSGSVLTQCLYVLPRFNVINNTKVSITCLAYNSDTKQPDVQQSVTVGPNEIKPFWNGDNQGAVLILEDTQSPTKPFSLEQFSTTVLATSKEDELCGLTVRVQPDTTHSAVLISVSPYVEGSAPIRVDNLSHNLQIDFTQQDTGLYHTLTPGQSKLYTWDKPSGKKLLQWKVTGEEKWTLLKYRQVEKHGSREVRIEGAEVIGTCCWMFGYEGSQRVLRIFDDADDNQLVEELHSPTSTQMSVQLFCSLEGVGLSLINSTPIEVVYACILSSPAVWLKKRPGGQSTVIEPKDSILLEMAWRTSDEDVEIDGETYDLTKMQILSRKGGSLSRVFNPGVWVWASNTEQQYSLNVKLGRLQLDNQLRDYAVANRIVLAPEMSLDPQEVIAPFLDAMVITSKPSKGQKVVEVEKAFMELKSVHLNIELGLITALVSLAEPFLERKLISRLGYSKKLVERPLSDILTVQAAHTSTHFKKFQLAPLKVTVTFTTAGDYDISGLLGQIVDSIVHFTSLITKGSMTIELGGIEIMDEMHDLKPLLSTIVSDYTQEILRQIYSVVFGLDVIGNPARLLNSFKVAAKDFISESRKGLDEGDLSDGVLGVAGGVKDFLGHVIEGSAESASSFTGTFQTSLLSVTDTDYRTMHRRRSQAAGGFTGNVLLGTKFFAEGIFHGLTDIVTKPVKGAEMEGVKGFLKGLGTGALSVLAKPTLGVVDLVHFTLEGIKCAVDDDAEQQVIRLTRFIHNNKVVTPFNTHEAQGLHILWSVLQLGKESYYGHEWLPTEKPMVFLVSSRHLYRLKRDGKQFKIDDWSAKIEYLEDWEVIPEENVDGPALCIKYGDDTFLDKVAFKLFSHEDHKAEVHKAVTFPMATEARAQHLSDAITEAWKDSKWNLTTPTHR